MNRPGRKIVVTGAASGIGYELVRQLHGEGNEVLAVDVDEGGLIRMNRQFPGLHTLRLDLCHHESVGLLIAWVKSNWQTLDIFFSNAGFARYGNWNEASLDDIKSLFQINAYIHMDLAKTIRDELTGETRLVVTASAMSYWAVPGYAAYAASKSAVSSWAEGVWSEGDGHWLTLAYPAATVTGFFQMAGKQVPRAYPTQRVKTVASSIINGAFSGKRKIFPSSLFRIMLGLNHILPFLKPIYCSMENRKLRKWNLRNHH